MNNVPAIRDAPTVYVIAGPNGAGKTTFATKFLPDFVKCREFLNADLIARGLSPFAPATQSRRAGRLLLERIHELAAARENFSIETTLAGRTYVRILSDLKAQGYRLVLFFLWLPTPEMAVQRVRNRVRQGGHDVPEFDIRRRYAAGVLNLVDLYRALVDDLWLYEGYRTPLTVIAREQSGNLEVFEPRPYGRIVRQAEESRERKL